MSAPALEAPARAGAALADGLPTVADTLDLVGDILGRPGADRTARAAALVAERRFDFPSGADLAGGLRRLGATAASGNDVEYVRLFLHGRPVTAHPYESFYRSGLLMDPACLGELDSLFAAAGVEPPEGAVAPDHISVELEFLALLLRGLVTAGGDGDAGGSLCAVAGELVDSHLRQFASAFRARLARLEPSAYFASAAEVLTLALESAAGLLDLAAPPTAAPA